MKRSKAELEFLSRYEPSDYPRPAVTVDVVVLTIVDTQLKVLLIQRKQHPFKGAWALPGGFLRLDKDPDLDRAADARAARRDAASIRSRSTSSSSTASAAPDATPACAW